jgi:hypothetical protein
MFWFLLPFIEQDNLYRQAKEYAYSPILQNGGPTYRAGSEYMQKVMLCPSDASGPDEGLWPMYNDPNDVGLWAFGNYGANFQVFGLPQAGDNPGNMMGQPDLGKSFPDGASNTILLAERYRRSADNYASLWAHGAWCVPYMALFAYGAADGSVGYVTADTEGGPPHPGAVGPVSKFQIQPMPFTSADPSRAQTPHAAMNVGLGDGSVRTLSGSIDPNTWWSLCTPAGGEVIAGDS